MEKLGEEAKLYFRVCIRRDHILLVTNADGEKRLIFLQLIYLAIEITTVKFYVSFLIFNLDILAAFETGKK